MAEEQVPQNPNQPQQPSAGNKDSNMMAMLCHLLGIFTWFIGPLIIWLIKKDQDKFVDDHGKEALNFQITIGIAYVISGITVFICIGPIIWAAAWICNLIFCIMGAVKANKGEAYRYPIAIRLIK